MGNLIKELMPQSLERTYQKLCGNTEIRIAIFSDIDSNGHFGNQWLIATDDEVMIFSPNGEEALLKKKLSFKEISKVETQSLIGCSSLEVTTSKGELIELMRYSNIHSTKFSATTKWLDQIAKGEQPSEITEEGPSRCPKCGLVLAEGSKVCPRCVQKGKILLRLINYLKPYWVVALMSGLLTLLATGVRLIPPYLTRTIIDDVFPSKDYALLGWMVLILAAISFAGTGFSV
ncbi:MAG: ATP-binding cassette, subfamily bacterial, partial [Candidatus Poribacteria bacterium]|nr:ATP-binding cassette, subfamily bacterial [Candidatus Poribacteria bacterium]